MVLEVEQVPGEERLDAFTDGSCSLVSLEERNYRPPWMILSHVDDLLLGGDQVAYASLMDLGSELGFGTIDKDEFVYCGKRIRQEKTGVIYVTMDDYHANLQPIKILGGRRKALDDELDAGELKQLRGLLGSFAMVGCSGEAGHGLSSECVARREALCWNYGESNACAAEVQGHSWFWTDLQALNMKNGGIVVVTDSSLEMFVRMVPLEKSLWSDSIASLAISSSLWRRRCWKERLVGSQCWTAGVIDCHGCAARHLRQSCLVLRRPLTLASTPEALWLRSLGTRCFHDMWMQQRMQFPFVS